jgi:hypothetical protein
MRLPRPAPLCSAAAIALAALLTGCSAAGPASADATTAAATGAPPAAHVHGVAIDPGDGTLLLATHEGLMEVGDGGEVTAAGPVVDLMGFTVTGPHHYLASGHPGLHTDLPQPVGLIESTDGGETWTPLSRAGASDFHALTALGEAGVLGYDGVLRRSPDGLTWEQLGIPAEPRTLAAAPDGGAVLATTAQGLLRSTDAGTTWAAVEGAPRLQVVAWVDAGTTVGVEPGRRRVDQHRRRANVGADRGPRRRSARGGRGCSRRNGPHRRRHRRRTGPVARRRGDVHHLADLLT